MHSTFVNYNCKYMQKIFYPISNMYDMIVKTVLYVALM